MMSNLPLNPAIALRLRFPRPVVSVFQTLVVRLGAVYSIALVFAALDVQSASPSLEQFHPVGFSRNSTNVVKLAGKVEPWPPQIWGAGAGVEITALTNKNELQFVVAADATPGVHLIRLFNDEGASEPRPFVVGAGRELVETEPNNQAGSPMAIPQLPISINGRLDKSGDVDSYQVHVPAGQRLVAAVDSYVLMSRLDAVLRLVTTNGMQLAWNHDFATLDPRLDWRADADTSVVVQVFGFAYPATADIKLTGGDGAIYRLHLSVEPPPLQPTNARPAELSLRATVQTFFAEPGERHRFKIQLAKNEWIAAAVAAESLGSPVDAWLAVENKDGKELTRADDSDGSRDPALNWEAPEDGEFALVVGSLTRNSGPEQFYELTAKRAAPAWRASLAASSLVAKAGSTNELKLTFTRLCGLTNAYQIVLPKLPEGVTCDPAPVPAAGGEVKLSFVAGENASAWQGPIQVLARDPSNSVERVIPFKLTGSTTDNGVPGGYRVLLADEIAHAWLTVLPKPQKTDEKNRRPGSSGGRVAAPGCGPKSRLGVWARPFYNRTACTCDQPSPAGIFNMNHHATIDRREFLSRAGRAAFGTMMTSALPVSALAAGSGKRLKVGAVFTAFTYRSHAHVILENFVAPYLFNGKWISPGMDVVSMCGDQFPEGELGREFAAKYRIPIYKTIHEALCLGGDKLAVNAVLSIGEHGTYPVNQKGQYEYPRKRFFDEIVAVFRRSGKSVPLFSDKHLSYRWDWAKEMYDTARELRFPLMAGSSVPLAQRRPLLELPARAKITEAVSIHGGGVESYDFHGLEVLQAMIEARRGGETGVARVQFLQSDALWKAAEDGLWSPQLAQAALDAEPNSGRLPARELIRPPKPGDASTPFVSHGILLNYRDGLRAMVLAAATGGGIKWHFACQLAGEPQPSATSFYVGPWNNRNLFKALSHAIQTHFRERRAPYPVERTLLVTGILDAEMESRLQGGKPMDTPQLAIAYQPRDYRKMREMGASWRIITDDTPEPKGIEKWSKP